MLIYQSTVPRKPFLAAAWLFRANLFLPNNTYCPLLACALAAQANYVVAADRDLLSLGKPFGIVLVTPAEFNRRLAES